MLKESQQIIYKRNGSLVSRLANGDVDNHGLRMLMYIRLAQPFVMEGNRLGIPTSNGKVYNTSEVTEVTVGENKIRCKTRNSLYEIEYAGINLSQILKDGPGNGVNRTNNTDIIPYFPGSK